MDLETRIATTADAAAIAAIARERGQDGPHSAVDADYLKHLFGEGAVAVTGEGGAVYAFGATRALGEISVLTDLFVGVAHEGLGLARRLLEHLWAQSPRATFSSQHPRALPLYLRYDVRPEWPLLHMRGDARRLSPSRDLELYKVTPREAVRAELTFSGTDRTVDYEYWTAVRGGWSFVVFDRGQTIAVGAATEEGIARLVCADGSPAADTLLCALAAFTDSYCGFAIPGPHPAVKILLEAGFTVEEYDILVKSPEVVVPTSWIYSRGLF